MYLNAAFAVNSILQNIALLLKKTAKIHNWIKLLSLLLLIASFDGRAQDVAFSQFFANPMLVNPAMTALEDAGKASLAYRNQWSGAVDPYVTYQASYEQYFPGIQGGLGFNVMNDRQGGDRFNSFIFDAIYAYQLKVSHNLDINAGFQASLGNRNLRTDDLVLPGDLVGVEESGIAGYSRFYADFAFGFAAFYKWLYGGFAMHHPAVLYFNWVNDSNEKLAPRYSAHLGALIPIFDKRFGQEVLKLSPQFVYVQQDIYQQLNYGMEVIFQGVMAGLWLRQDFRFSYSTLIFSAGYSNSKFSLRYSYDVKLSAPDLHIPTLSTHELSLSVSVGNMNKSKGKGTIKSSKF